VEAFMATNAEVAALTQPEPVVECIPMNARSSRALFLVQAATPRFEYRFHDRRRNFNVRQRRLHKEKATDIGD
jgi:hypothetical protein